MVRDQRLALIAETENACLARQFREESHAGKVRRRAALLLGLVVLLAASAAYALDIECPSSVGGDVCLGTDGDDVMKGTNGLDSIVGLSGDDTIHGLASPDLLFGGDGSDELIGGADADLLSGERGSDGISADFLFSDGTDTVEGGHGNDSVNAVEGQRDVIDCGPCQDRVEFDAGLDSVKRCEIKAPISGA
jgi:hypothetical protein